MQISRQMTMRRSLQFSGKQHTEGNQRQALGFVLSTAAFRYSLVWSLSQNQCSKEHLHNGSYKHVLCFQLMSFNKSVRTKGVQSRGCRAGQLLRLWSYKLKVTLQNANKCPLFTCLWMQRKSSEKSLFHQGSSSAGSEPEPSFKPVLCLSTPKAPAPNQQKRFVSSTKTLLG